MRFLMGDEDFLEDLIDVLEEHQEATESHTKGPELSRHDMVADVV